MASKKEALMEATMRVVTENGFGGFSLKQITDLAGVGETLIYKHFETKENLLYQCFYSVHRDLCDFEGSYSVDEVKKRANEVGAFSVFKEIWFEFLDLQIKNSYRTLYYYEYRNSIYVNNILNKKENFFSGYLQDFIDCFEICEGAFNINGFEKRHIFWTYIIEGTGMFARRIIRGEIKDTPENREMVWSIIFNGMSGFIEKI